MPKLVCQTPVSRDPPMVGIDFFGLAVAAAADFAVAAAAEENLEKTSQYI